MFIRSKSPRLTQNHCYLPFFLRRKWFRSATLSEIITTWQVHQKCYPITHLNTHTQKLTKSLCIGVLKMAGNGSQLVAVAEIKRKCLVTETNKNYNKRNVKTSYCLQGAVIGW